MISNEISRLLAERIEAKDFPSAVYLAAEKGEIVLHGAVGSAVVEPERIEAREDTIYDLASLTKPLVTGLLCAKLIERKELNLGRMINFYLPEFDTPEAVRNSVWDMTIATLLLHRSRFPAWKPFYLFVGGREEITAEIVRTPRDFDQPIVTYSDLNFLVLTFLLEKIYGEKIDRIAHKEIFAPLGLKDTFYNPPRALKRRIAASERGNEFEKNMCAEKGFDASLYRWREQTVWGEVHDGNCYFMGGASGHAGLFSTAEEVFRIARQFLPGTTELLRPETCALFRTNYTKGPNEARSIAFQLAETAESAGEALSKDAFGHLGFTGTSLWIEPAGERTYILLTNRTHARSLPFVLLNSTRREFHRLATEFLNGRG